mmetsp:Transcript_48695/g.103912  ORF Transcript_48695/g.103912 Transcript_48695/m.103912 type:complete len:209 (+) Transcript_48695:191-817(+)
MTRAHSRYLVWWRSRAHRRPRTSTRGRAACFSSIRSHSRSVASCSPRSRALRAMQSPTRCLTRRTAAASFWRRAQRRPRTRHVLSSAEATRWRSSPRSTPWLAVGCLCFSTSSSGGRPISACGSAAPRRRPSSTRATSARTRLRSLRVAVRTSSSWASTALAGARSLTSTTAAKCCRCTRAASMSGQSTSGSRPRSMSNIRSRAGRGC